MASQVNPNALKSEVRGAIINQKANACPMAVRLAWHASGTFDKNDGTGGSDGATMRFDPERSDPANKGLYIINDMLHEVKKRHPELSTADLWTFAGASAVEFTGGPSVPFKFCRSDHPDDSKCPANGRLPDANQGAQHLRDVFYRMGFDDREIVALSGAHTLGRCHLVRSGFDGPWTSNPLSFDNEYFRNLMHKEWRERNWEGPRQFEDVETGKLMMLPTDMALRTDPAFRKYAEIYANDEKTFFEDFAKAFAKLLAAGTNPPPEKELTAKDKASAEFREWAMHGSLEFVKKFAKEADVHATEASSGRTALHKAAFWGHDGTVDFLLKECKLDPNVQDYNGDTALHDAARFGHASVARILIKNGADTSIKNKQGMDIGALSKEYGKSAIGALL